MLTPTSSRPAWSPAFARRTEGVSGELAAILALAAGSDLISFAGGLPDPQTFPVTVLLELTRTHPGGRPGKGLAVLADPRPARAPRGVRRPAPGH